MQDTVSTLDNIFRTANIIENNSFTSLKSKRDNLSSINNRLNEIIESCKNVVSLKESKNPNFLVAFIKDDKIKKEIASTIFKNSTEQEDKNWFLLEYIYMILFRSETINLKEMVSTTFYINNVGNMYEFIKKTDIYKDMYKELRNKFCGDNININKIRESLKKEFNSYVNVPVSAKVCEEKFGTTELTKDCIEAQLCEILIKKDAINQIKSNEFKKVIERTLYNILIYYSYLGNQASFTLQFIQYQLNEQMEKTTNNRQMQNISSKLNLIRPVSFNIPPQLYNEFSKITEQQMKQLGQQYGGANYILKKMDKIPNKEFKMMVEEIGKENVLKFLNKNKNEKLAKKLINKLK